MTAADSVDPRSFLPLTPLAFQVLLALADGDRHGYGIIREVDERTDGLIKLRTGTLYTMLQRLLDEGLIEATPGTAVERSPGVQGSAPGGVQGGAPGGVQGPPPIKSAHERSGVGGPPPIKNDDRRKYYGLTSLGRGVLSAEATRLHSLVDEARRKHVLGRESKV